MARGGWNQWATVKAYSPAHCRMTRDNVARVCEEILTLPYEEIVEISKDREEIGLIQILARSLVFARKNGDFRSLDRVLDRVIGRVSQSLILQPPPASNVPAGKVSFEDFCTRAGYPAPYPKQIEMREFWVTTPGIKLLLGSRGYGKTDYVVILGTAYEIYLDPTYTELIVTKSRERNASFIAEIGKALAANGVEIEQQNASFLRILGLQGKEHSVSSVTIGTVSLRGRHPRKIVMDDPVTEDDVSEATRKKVQRVYNEAVKLSADLLIVGQPVHKFDLYETIRPLVKKLELPHGTIPQLDHDLEAQRLAGVSEESIQSSYFLKVISESGFPLELVGSLPHYPVGDSVAFIDPAFEGSDYTALTIGRGYFDGLAVKGRLWRRAWYNCVDEMADEFRVCGVKRLAFETNKIGDQPLDLLRSVLDDSIGVVGRYNTVNKHARISAVGPFAQSVFIAETSDRLYKDHVRKYEFGSKFDDGPDSLAGLMEWIGLIRGKAK